MKKNRTAQPRISGRRRLFVLPAAFFIALLLASCSGSGNATGLALTAGINADASMTVRANWNVLEELIPQSAGGEPLTTEVIFDLTLRNREILAGRRNYQGSLLMGYDPYNGVYYVEDGEDVGIFYDVEKLSEYLAQGVSFLIPAEDLIVFEGASIEFDVRARILRIRKDSTFARWLRLFNFYQEYERTMIQLGYSSMTGKE